MVKSLLLNQENYLGSVKNGNIQNPRLAIPCKFANGYFFTGNTPKGREVYATLNEESKNLVQKIWSTQENKSEEKKDG